MITTINHNNMPEALEFLIREVESIKNIINDKQLNNVTEFDRITSIDEVCRITGFSKSKIYKLSANKEIPFKTIGNRLVFSKKDLLNWLDNITKSPVKRKSEVLTAIAESASEK